MLKYHWLERWSLLLTTTRISTLPYYTKLNAILKYLDTAILLDSQHLLLLKFMQKINIRSKFENCTYETLVWKVPSQNWINLHKCQNYKAAFQVVCRVVVMLYELFLSSDLYISVTFVESVFIHDMSLTVVCLVFRSILSDQVNHIPVVDLYTVWW